MERKQFKELLKDKEEEIELLSSQQGFEDQFQELNKLLNTEKLKNEELSKKQVKNNDDLALKKELEQKELFVQQIQVQHQQAIEIMKQSTQVAVEDNNKLTEQIAELERNLSEQQDIAKAAQVQLEQVQNKLEEFSAVHEENSNLKIDKMHLENQVSKLKDSLDNGQNQHLEEASDKIQLENE